MRFEVKKALNLAALNFSVFNMAGLAITLIVLLCSQLTLGLCFYPRFKASTSIPQLLFYILLFYLCSEHILPLAWETVSFNLLGTMKGMSKLHM